MGLRENLNAGVLPAGQLVIDRAGYNQESSPALFTTAVELLVHVLLAGVFGSPAEPVIRSWVATGRIPDVTVQSWCRSVGMEGPGQYEQPQQPSHP
jgi:hypothetical protein